MQLYIKYFAFAFEIVKNIIYHGYIVSTVLRTMLKVFPAQIETQASIYYRLMHRGGHACNALFFSKVIDIGIVKYGNLSFTRSYP